MRKTVIVILLAAALAACQRQQPAAPAATDAGQASTLRSVDEFRSVAKADDPSTWPGAEVFTRACASCHLGQVPKAPQKMFLQMMSGPTILDSLEKGLMMPQAAALSAQERRDVSEYLSGARLDAQKPVQPRMCTAADSELDATMPPLRAGWGYHNARFTPAEEAGLQPADAARLKLKWAFVFPNAIQARSQPSIAWGAVFVGSQDGHVYAFDLDSGCARWVFKAGAEVRTAVVPYEAEGGPDRRVRPPRVYFGDVIGRVYSLDARTGRLEWSVKVDDHPNATLTGTGTFHEGVIYQPVSSLEVTSAADPKYECCSFRGAVVALDAWTGEQRWKNWSIPQPPREVRRTSAGTRVLGPSGAPIWNSPMIDAKRGLLYVGTGQNYSSPADDRSNALIAFRLSDGRQMWARQMLARDAWNVACMMQDNPNCPTENGPDVDFGAGTILVDLGGGRQALVAGQKSGVVHALDPAADGRVLWQTRVGRGGIQGGIHFGMAAEGTRIYAPVSDMADGRDGRKLEGPPRPGLNALDAATGRLLWSTPANDICNGEPYCDPGISAAVSASPGLVYAGHMDGRFRVYDGANGKVLYEYDSRQPVTGVNGIEGRGGSFGGAGPAIRRGHVVVNSGYGLYFHMPGNVLLVFAPG